MDLGIVEKRYGIFAQLIIFRLYRKGGIFLFFP